MANKEMTIKVNLENLEDDERERLLALIEKANKPKSKVWKPKKGEDYYIIDNYGRIELYVPYDDYYTPMHIAIGNCFRTREEAEFAVERLKVIQELREFATEENTEDDKYQIMILDTCNEILTWKTRRHYGALRFATEEDIKSAIETVGADRIKKYYFGIK